jgi:lipoprotein-anchoring transpeptidase ErfK/SrfK
MARSLALTALAAAALFLSALSAPGATSSRATTIGQPLTAKVIPTLVSAPAAPPQKVLVASPKPVRHILVDVAGARVRSWPGGPSIGTMAATTPLGSRSWAWAVSRSNGWARVVLPWRPNGRYGWIKLAGRRTVRTDIWVRADLSRRTVTLMRGRGKLRTFKAAIGAPASPTPTGRFNVTDLVATGNPSGPFGWYAFGLSGHQPNLPPGWGGGDQLAIHGTNSPSSIGTAASAGCLRVSAGALTILKRYLRLGTPVVIDR